MVLVILFIFSGFISFCQQIMTVGEVYDYDINDEFHFRALNIPPNAIRNKIIGKYFSVNNDTVFYVRNYNNYSSYVDYTTNPPHLVYSISTGTNTMFYTNLDSLMSSEYFFIPPDSCYSFFDTAYYSTEYCDSLVYEYETCAACCFEGEYTNEIFGKGIGLIWHYYSYPAQGVEEQGELFYYRKAMSECGTPDTNTPVSIIELQNLENKIAIYPNPTHNLLTIEQQSPITSKQSAAIYDLTGKVLLQFSISSQKQTIDISALSSGVYFLTLDDGEQSVNKKIVKQ